MKGEAGYVPALTDSIMMGAKINYYHATFSEQITGGTTLAKTTNSRTVIYPSFVMTLRWD